MENLYIETSYQLFSVDGDKKEMVEATQEGRPFVFITGMGFTLTKFEEELSKLKKGEEYTLSLTPAEAYGERNENMVDELDKSMFCVEGGKFDEDMFHEGVVIPLQNSEGAMFYGTITKITDKKVVIDINHPLAGKNLLFEGKVLENRAATKDELTTFVNAMNSESCGCGSCGDGCECGCGDDHNHEGGCGCGCGCH